MRRAATLKVLLATSLLSFAVCSPLGAQQTDSTDAHAGSPPSEQSILGAQPSTPISADRVIGETELDRQTRAVSAQLRCVVCQGLSIQDSPSTLAQEMRDVVREQLAVGRTPDEVKAYFVANYGEWVLLEPEPSGFNLVVYVLPALMLIGGALFVFLVARNMTRGARSRPAPSAEERDREEAPF